MERKGGAHRRVHGEGHAPCVTPLQVVAGSSALQTRGETRGAASRATTWDLQGEGLNACTCQQAVRHPGTG